MSARSNARLIDRVRRLIPSQWRGWIDNRLSSNMTIRRLIGRFLTNSRDIAVIRQELSVSQGPWRRFTEGTTTVGSSERVVEIPWVLTRYGGQKRVLDVGTSFALDIYVEALSQLGIQDLHGVDIAPRDFSGIRMTQADVRKMPFPDAAFDLILCVSTLEHVGL